MRLLKDSAVPTLFSYCAGKQPRKRKGIAGRQEKAAKKNPSKIESFLFQYLK